MASIKAGCRRVALWIVRIIGVLIVVVLSIPVLRLLYGSAQAYWFASHLAVGVSSEQVESWRSASGGSTQGTLNSGEAGVRIDETGSHVWFVTGVLPCQAWGEVYTLHFDGADRLRDWHADPWTDGC
jgi:hypothetical protein